MTDRRSDPSRGVPEARDEHFSSTAGRMLRESADQLDTATAARLKRDRAAALEAMRHRPARPAWLTPGLSAAALGVLAVGLWTSREPASPGAEPLAAAVESAADLDLLLAADSLEMLEDLEFYAWLDTELSEEQLRPEPESGS